MNINTMGVILLGVLLCVFVPLHEGTSASNDQPFLEIDTPEFKLRLSKDSQTVAGLEPKNTPGFDFTPGDRLERRATNGYHHLGDLTLRVRTGTSGSWQKYDT